MLPVYSGERRRYCFALATIKAAGLSLLPRDRYGVSVLRSAEGNKSAFVITAQRCRRRVRFLRRSRARSKGLEKESRPKDFIPGLSVRAQEGGGWPRKRKGVPVSKSPDENFPRRLYGTDSQSGAEER